MIPLQLRNDARRPRVDGPGETNRLSSTHIHPQQTLPRSPSFTLTQFLRSPAVHAPVLHLLLPAYCGHLAYLTLSYAKLPDLELITCQVQATSKQTSAPHQLSLPIRICYLITDVRCIDTNLSRLATWTHICAALCLFFRYSLLAQRPNRKKKPEGGSAGKDRIPGLSCGEPGI